MRAPRDPPDDVRLEPRGRRGARRTMPPTPIRGASVAAASRSARSARRSGRQRSRRRSSPRARWWTRRTRRACSTRRRAHWTRLAVYDPNGTSGGHPARHARGVRGVRGGGAAVTSFHVLENATVSCPARAFGAPERWPPPSREPRGGESGERRHQSRTNGDAARDAERRGRRRQHTHTRRLAPDASPAAKRLARIASARAKPRGASSRLASGGAPRTRAATLRVGQSARAAGAGT